MKLLIDICALFMCSWLFIQCLISVLGKSLRTYQVKLLQALRAPEATLRDVHSKYIDFKTRSDKALQQLKCIHDAELSRWQQLVEIRYNIQLKKIHISYQHKLRQLKISLQKRVIKQMYQQLCERITNTHIPNTHMHDHAQAVTSQLIRCKEILSNSSI